MKEAKIDKTPQKNLDTKTNEGTNGHHERKTDIEVLEQGDIVFMCKLPIHLK